MANELKLEIIMNAVDKASAAFKKIRDSSNFLYQGLHQAETEVRKLDKAQQDLIRRTNLDKKMQENSKALLENIQAQRKLKQEINQSGTAGPIVIICAVWMVCCGIRITR